MRLEEIKPEASLNGLEPAAVATVVAVAPKRSRLGNYMMTRTPRTLIV